jgi:serine/threonine protein kinase
LTPDETSWINIPGGCFFCAHCLPSGKRFGVKQYNSEWIRLSSNLTTEVSIFRTLTDDPHDNVAQLHDAFWSTCHKHLYLVMPDYGTELYRVVERKKEEQAPFDTELAFHVVTQLEAAVQHLHSKNIVHQDISLENLIIDQNNHLTLIDFGHAQTVVAPDYVVSNKDGPIKTLYSAPPLLRRMSCNGFRADWWSVAIVAFIVHTYEPPYNGDDANLKRIEQTGLYAFAHDYMPKCAHRLDPVRNSIHAWTAPFVQISEPHMPDLREPLLLECGLMNERTCSLQ